MSRPTRVVTIETGRGSPSERAIFWPSASPNPDARVLCSRIAVGQTPTAFVRGEVTVMRHGTV